MSKNARIVITRVLIVAFILFLFPSDSFSIRIGEKTGLLLIKEGEKLFRNYKYQESIEKFRDAEKYVKLEKNLSRLYLGISRSYYAMGLLEQVKEAINKLAMLNVKSSFKKSEYPRGYLKIYDDILSEIEKNKKDEQIVKLEKEKKKKDELIVKTEEEPESLYQVKKTEEETKAITNKEDKTPERVIEKPGMKKKKKKFPILLVAAGVVAIAAIVLLSGKKKDDSSTIYNPPTPTEKTPADEVLESIEWMSISSGSFKMGDNFNDGNPNERPVHSVYLDSYYISKYEVTFEQYDKFCDDTNRSKPDDEGWGRSDRPVMRVTWNDAVAFCEWLTNETGTNVHLPYEAQWEKAARGTDQRKYPWGNGNPDSGLCNSTGYVGKTQPVGSYSSGTSPYGVHDMAGNVWEWCHDWYDPNYYSVSPSDNPKGPSSGSYRIIRGGSWKSNWFDTRSIYRNYNTTEYSNYKIGFRVVRD